MDLPAIFVSVSSSPLVTSPLFSLSLSLPPRWRQYDRRSLCLTPEKYLIDTEIYYHTSRSRPLLREDYQSLLIASTALKKETADALHMRNLGR